MIDVSYEIKKFRPINIAAIPADEKYGENVRLAFALYNKAIQKIKDGYEDLARIDLKRPFSSFRVFMLRLFSLECALLQMETELAQLGYSTR